MSDQRHELCSQLMSQHAEKLLRENAGTPDLCAAIRRLLRGDNLSRACDLFVEVASEILCQEEMDQGTTREGASTDFILAVTFYRTSRIPIVARAFPGGYLKWLSDAFERAAQTPGQPGFAHWIFIMDGKNVITHLTVTQTDLTKYKVFAWDFFNPNEIRRLFPSDPRPPQVKAQWGL